ncbi:MAG: hypothetical protein ACE367_14025 [Acidimicrobiales bacterium]
MTDNSQLTYYRENLTPKMYSAVAFTLNNHVAPTDVAVQPEDSGAGTATDIIYWDFDYSTYCGKDWHPDGPDPDSKSVIGLYVCESLSGQKCNRSKVRFDTSWTSPKNTTKVRALSCHETGHALGLRHLANAGTNVGCMPGSLKPVVNFSAHDVAHINANY